MFSTTNKQKLFKYEAYTYTLDRHGKNIATMWNWLSFSQFMILYPWFNQAFCTWEAWMPSNLQVLSLRLNIDEHLRVFVIILVTTLLLLFWLNILNFLFLLYVLHENILVKLVSGWCLSNFGSGLQASKPDITHKQKCY